MNLMTGAGVAVAAMALTVVTGASGSPAQADYTTTINPSNQWGTWDGWGCSLCWWANVFGTRDDLADIVFSRNTTVLNGQSLPGLGLNIVRYNAGACTNTDIDGASMVASAKILAFRQMPGYWLNPDSTDPASSRWNWNADANQRKMLQKARDRGANHFELFSNSPMWWMCDNSNPSGASNGANDNLQSRNQDSAAIYLATIAKYAVSHWGIRFDSVDPFNEPISTWWTSSGTQEGCHFNRSTQGSVIGFLRAELDNRGLTGTLVSASDENTYDQATSTYNSFSSSTKAQIGRVNVHGYQYGAGRRDLLHNAVAGKKLWNSEYGESDGTGMSLAANLNLDLRNLHPTAWCYWQPFDSGGWGLVRSNLGAKRIGSVNPKYFVLAQYTRHIRPGMIILDGGEENTITAYDSTAHKLVIVTTTYGTAQRINYDLSRFSTVSGPITRWNTNTGGGDSYVPYSDTALSGKQFLSNFAANSIQTFEIQNVYL